MSFDVERAGQHLCCVGKCLTSVREDAGEAEEAVNLMFVVPMGDLYARGS